MSREIYLKIIRIFILWESFFRFLIIKKDFRSKKEKQREKPIKVNDKFIIFLPLVPWEPKCKELKNIKPNKRSSVCVKYWFCASTWPHPKIFTFSLFCSFILPTWSDEKCRRWLLCKTWNFCVFSDDSIESLHCCSIKFETNFAPSSVKLEPCDECLVLTFRLRL